VRIILIRQGPAPIMHDYLLPHQAPLANGTHELHSIMGSKSATNTRFLET